MVKFLYKCIALVSILFACSLSSLAQRAVPPLWGHRVHDEAKVLSQATIDELETLLERHEDSTTNQIAVLLIPSLDGDVLEDYSLRVAEEWKLGKEKTDNGVLLLIAVNDHKMRIEVGQGLEGVLTDISSNQIIRNEIAPHFREQDYDGGVRAGVQAIIAQIAGEYSAGDPESASPELTLKEKILVGAFVFGILGIFTALGLFMPGCMGWALYAFLIPFWAAFPMAILGVDGGLGVLITYLVSFPILKIIAAKTPWGKKMATKAKSGGRRSSTGWTSGSGWFSGGSGGSGWSSGGGGGFSGGGGSFGGGGSSGSW